MCICFLRARKLFVACCDHTRTHYCTALCIASNLQDLRVRDIRHFDLDVDAIEQRAGDARSVPCDLIRRAAAAPARVTQISTRAETRCLFASGDSLLPKVRKTKSLPRITADLGR